MVPLNEIFDIGYGNSLELNSLEISSERDKDAINFVSRTRENNGVSAVVKKIESIEPFEAGLITVAGSGNSVLESFIQPKPFYTGYHVFILKPKKELTALEQLYYCYCIRQNQYKYSYGRQANRTLKNLQIPSIDEIPDWVNETVLPLSPSDKPYHNKIVTLQDRKWKWFDYKDIFVINSGFYNKKPPISDDGIIPFIGATDSNNGVTSYHTLEDIEITSKTGDGNNHPLSKKIFKGGEYITISNNGSVGYAFYQPVDFTCSHDVNPISIKGVQMTPYIAMFLCTLIHLEKFRWDYGRKWRPVRMPLSKIKLPINNDGTPDWEFMEYYIKSLPYSSNLENMEKESKGLSDQELIKKYEAGEVDMQKVTRKMLVPSNTAVKTVKQKAKREP